MKDKLRQEHFMYFKLFLVVIAYGFNGTSYTAIPFLFYRSKLSCLDDQGQLYSCSLEEACVNENGYTQVSEYSQIYSITQQFDLYCDRKIIEAWILTLANFAKIVSYIILCLYPIEKAIKERFIYLCMVIIGVQLCLLNWIQTTEMFIIAFCVWYLFFTLFYGLVYTYFVESFPTSIAKYGPALLNTSWPGTMLVYIVFTYFYGTWENSLVDFTGIPLLFIGILGFIAIKIEKQQDFAKGGNPLNESLIAQHTSQSNLDVTFQNQTLAFDQFLDIEDLKRKESISAKTSPFIKEKSYQYQQTTNPQPNVTEFEPKSKFQFIENYKFLQDDKRVRNNFLIWTLGWACNGVCYVGCYLQLNTLKGDLFFNSFSTTLCEVAAGLIGTFLIFRYSKNLKTIIILSFFTIGIAFISCMFMENPNSSNSGGSSDSSILIILLYLFPIIIAKISYEINWTLLVTYQKSVIPVQHHQAQFSCSSLVSVLFCDVTPFYKYFAESIGFNVFVGFGIICLCSAYTSLKYQEIPEQENVQYNKQNESPSKDQNIELQEMKS